MALLRSCSALFGVAALLLATRARADTPPVPPPEAPAKQVATDKAPTEKAPGDKAATEKEERAKQAMTLHDEAWTLYEEGRYHAAIERLESALRVDPEGRELVYNLGLLHEKLADLKTAAIYYRRYLEMETDPKVRARVIATLRRIEGAEREIARPLAPAAAPLVAGAPARRWETPPSRRGATVAVAGVAVAAFLTGVGFGMSAIVRNPGDGARTGGNVTIADLQGDAHTAHTDAVVADVAFIVAAAATATAILIHATTPSPRVASLASTSSTPSVASRGGLQVLYSCSRGPACGWRAAF